LFYSRLIQGEDRKFLLSARPPLFPVNGLIPHTFQFIVIFLAGIPEKVLEKPEKKYTYAQTE